MDQITKQLNSGIVDFEDDPSLASQISGHESSGHALNTEVISLFGITLITTIVLISEALTFSIWM